MTQLFDPSSVERCLDPRMPRDGFGIRNGDWIIVYRVGQTGDPIEVGKLYTYPEPATIYDHALALWEEAFGYGHGELRRRHIKELPRRILENMIVELERYCVDRTQED